MPITIILPQHMPIPTYTICLRQRSTAFLKPNMYSKSSVFFLSINFILHITHHCSLCPSKIPISFSLKHHVSLRCSITDLTEFLYTIPLIFKGKCLSMQQLSAFPIYESSFTNSTLSHKFYTCFIMFPISFLAFSTHKIPCQAWGHPLCLCTSSMDPFPTFLTPQ